MNKTAAATAASQSGHDFNSIAALMEFKDVPCLEPIKLTNFPLFFLPSGVSATHFLEGFELFFPEGKRKSAIGTASE